MAKKKIDMLNSKSKSEKVVFGVAFVLLLLYALSFLYPLVWLFLNSMKKQLHYLEDLSQLLALPRQGKWLYTNYPKAFEEILYNDTNFLGMFFNSIWTCVLSVGINMFLSCCTGYVLSKYKFKGRDFIYGAAIVCMTLPIFGTGGASYTFYYESGMYDTPFYIVFSNLGAFGTRFLMMYAFFKGVSWEYAEAVLIDGGNDYTVFFKIMLPIAFPMVLTLFITGFIQIWNSYEAYLLYIPSFPTLAVGIYQVSERFDNNQPVYYAAMIISLLPVVAIFIAFSDTIMRNFSIGGLKG
jgi:ABC-type glycerol-3-phosphate transport system permease component